MRFLSSLLFLALSLATAAPAATEPRAFVIGLSPFLDQAVKDEVYRGLVRLVVQDLPLNSSLAVYDAFNLKTVTQFTVPESRAFNSPKTRANQFAPAIRELRQFLAADHAKPAAARLDFNGAIRLPQFGDFVAQNRSRTGDSVTLLLLGNPLYQDAKEPAFSMIDGYFPSDGHLLVSREQSIFGRCTDTNAGPRFTAHWVYFGDPWLSALHQEKITRFWSLYLQARGDELRTFTGDLATALRNFVQPSSAAPVLAGRWSLAPDDTKVEMLRIQRSVELTDWLTRDALPETPPRPPTGMVGPMKIGIRWKADLDLDLYATPRAGAETLFFQHPHSAEGYYYKDHRSSPGREYEFIEFETPIDVREVEAFVNFYKGSCPGGPRGEVRIEFDGRIYHAPFAIRASDGNRGRSGSAQEECWARIPVQEILQVEPSAQARR